MRYSVVGNHCTLGRAARTSATTRASLCQSRQRQYGSAPGAAAPPSCMIPSGTRGPWWDLFPRGTPLPRNLRIHTRTPRSRGTKPSERPSLSTSLQPPPCRLPRSTHASRPLCPQRVPPSVSPRVQQSQQVFRLETATWGSLPGQAHHVRSSLGAHQPRKSRHRRKSCSPLAGRRATIVLGPTHLQAPAPAPTQQRKRAHSLGEDGRRPRWPPHRRSARALRSPRLSRPVEWDIPRRRRPHFWWPARHR